MSTESQLSSFSLPFNFIWPFRSYTFNHSTTAQQIRHSHLRTWLSVVTQTKPVAAAAESSLNEIPKSNNCIKIILNNWPTYFCLQSPATQNISVILRLILLKNKTKHSTKIIITFFCRREVTLWVQQMNEHSTWAPHCLTLQLGINGAPVLVSLQPPLHHDPLSPQTSKMSGSGQSHSVGHAPGIGCQ